jgi:hypothetical protein
MGDELWPALASVLMDVSPESGFALGRQFNLPNLAHRHSPRRLHLYRLTG